MTPTICMGDMPKTATDAPSVRRKYWHDGSINKPVRGEFRQLSIENGCWDANRNDAAPQARIPGPTRKEQLRITDRRRKGN